MDKRLLIILFLLFCLAGCNKSYLAKPIQQIETQKSITGVKQVKPDIQPSATDTFSNLQEGKFYDWLAENTTPAGQEKPDGFKSSYDDALKLFSTFLYKRQLDCIDYYKDSSGNIDFNKFYMGDYTNAKIKADCKLKTWTLYLYGRYASGYQWSNKLVLDESTGKIIDGTSLIQLSMSTLKCGYALTNDNHVLKTSDGGMTWNDIYTISNVGRAAPAPSLCAVNEQAVYIAAFEGGSEIFVSTENGGKTWLSKTIEPSMGWEKDDVGGLSLSFSDPENGYILVMSTPGAGQMLKALYKTSDCGANWIIVSRDNAADETNRRYKPTGINGYPGELSFSTVDKGSVNCTWAGPNGVLFYKTDNGGTTWESYNVRLPEKYSGLADGSFYVTAYSPSFYGENNKNGKMILKFSQYTPKGKFFYTYLYTTSDGGRAWTLDCKCNVLIKNYDFIDNNNGFGLDESGMLYTTNDGGITWDEITETD